MKLAQQKDFTSKSIVDVVIRCAIQIFGEVYIYMFLILGDFSSSENTLDL